MRDSHTLLRRRELLRRCGRFFLLAAGFSALTRLCRRGQIARDRHVCIQQGICSRCERASGCGLPQALSRRRNLRGES